MDKTLSNQLYIGNIIHGKKDSKEIHVFEGVVPAIISKSDFDCVQKRKEKKFEKLY